MDKVKGLKVNSVPGCIPVSFASDPGFEINRKFVRSSIEQKHDITELIHPRVRDSDRTHAHLDRQGY